MRTRTMPGAALLLAAIACACNSRDDVREWRPSDHGNTSTPAASQAAPARGRPTQVPAGQNLPPGMDPVSIAAWRRNCTRCHGRFGRGDGPEGKLVNATNLSDPAWQGSVTDEQIRTAITRGKGAMPAFEDIPASTVDGLVKLVRMMDIRNWGAGRGAPAGHPSPRGSSPSAAPASAKPPASAAAPKKAPATN